MLSAQTRHFLSSFFRAASHVRLPTSNMTILSKPSPVLAYTSNSLLNIPKAFFGHSPRKNPDSEISTESGAHTNPKEKISRLRKPKPLQEATISQEEESPKPIGETANNMIAPRLVTVPIKTMKLPLEKGEEKLKVETYILYSGKTPVIPFSKQMGLGNVEKPASARGVKKKAFFMENEAGEIYTIGIVVNEEVEKPQKKIPSNYANNPYLLNEVEKKVKKPKNSKVKLVEIEVREDCVLAKGIPYNDVEALPGEKLMDTVSITDQIKKLVNSLNQTVSREKIEGFDNISSDLIYTKKLEPERIDEFLWNIIAGCFKISNYTKENLQLFIQAFLEQRSTTFRLLMVKRKLEETMNVFDIVTKSGKYADEQIWKLHEQAKARLSLDYIRSQFFSGDNESSAGKTEGANSKTVTSSDGVPLTGQAKKFMEKLHLIPDEASRERVRKEIEKFGLQDKIAGEYHKLYTYLDEVFSIPWENMSEEHWNIDYSKQVLEERLYGLEKVKERIVEMIAVNKLKRALEQRSDKKKGFVILLNGPPGTGKTTIAKAIAAALKRESRFISFAGVTDSSFVKGHKRTYVDAQPGVFVKELIKSKVMNPVFILDEVDKLSKNFQGADPYYALMEILNPEENCNFTDHYLDIKVDFSHVVFILTSNEVLNMLEPLRNRLEIIEVPAYIEQEKLTIAKNYLIPEVMKEHGLSRDNIYFDDETITRIIKGWCYYESGVRELRRCFEKIARKQAREILNNYQIKQSQETTNEAEPKGEQNISLDNRQPANIIPQQKLDQLIELKSQAKLCFNAAGDPEDEMLKKYLGNPIFDDMYERRNKKPFIGNHSGTANVLTVSGFVGHVLTVECVFDPSGHGKGLLTSSGNLQNVLQESLTIARLVAFKFLQKDKVREFTDKNVHIHFLEGSTPKDGPSAGVSICSAFLSLMLNKPIPQDISMTGELSLNGDVCKIGGVQAKVTASKALDIKRIILPWGNKTEFMELPKMLKEGLTVYFVKEYREVFTILFGDSAEALESIETYSESKNLETIRPMSSVSTNLPVTMKNN